MGRFPSGQRGQTVNLLAFAFDGSNPSLPIPPNAEVAQLVEQHLDMVEVVGSSPIPRTEIVSLINPQPSVDAGFCLMGYTSSLGRVDDDVAGGRGLHRAELAHGGNKNVGCLVYLLLGGEAAP